MIILGIDPGVATTGYGVIKVSKNTRRGQKENCACIEYGAIKTASKTPMPERLKKINEALSALIKRHKPQALAVESLYFFKNFKTALPVSQVKGVILLNAAIENIPVYEFTPLQIKMAMTGYGRAEKAQVQEMVKKEFKITEALRPDDAADALAAAICCNNFIKNNRLN